MAFQLLGAGNNLLETDPTFLALRQTPRPIEYGSFGHYQISATSGLMAAGVGVANAVMFAFRWGDGSRIALVTYIDMVPLTGTIFAAGVTDYGYDLFKVTGYSASHGGGTAISMAGENGKLRTTFPSSLVTDMRIASTTALTGGTATFPASPLAQSLTHISYNNAAAEADPPGTKFACRFAPNLAAGEHPLHLAQNEGVVIRNRIAWPITGTVVVQVEIRWIELLESAWI